MRIRFLFPVAAAALLCASLTGCGGNKSKVIKASIKECSERYGVEFRFKKKKLFAGGADCNVYVTCKELPKKRVHIFRLDNHAPLCCDFISVKYSDALYEKTVSAVSGVNKNKYSDTSDWNIIVHEKDYNHFPPADFDKNTTFEDYVRDTPLETFVVIPQPLESDIMTGIYTDVMSALEKNGLAMDLSVYSMKDKKAADEVGHFDHVTERLEFSEVSSANAYSYSVRADGTFRIEVKGN